MTPMVKVNMDGDVTWATLAEFLADNADDEEVCLSVEALRIGETAVFGGGAGVLVEVTRVA